MLKQQLAESKEQLLHHLQSPMKVRFGALAVLWLAGYAAVYHPLEEATLQARLDLKTEQARLETVRSIQKLNREAEVCAERVLLCEHFNEWEQGMVDATRQHGLLVRNMEKRETKELGPYHVILLKLELEGYYAQLLDFMKWVEEPSRANRVDLFRVKRESDYLYVTLEIRGLVEKTDA